MWRLAAGWCVLLAAATALAAEPKTEPRTQPARTLAQRVGRLVEAYAKSSKAIVGVSAVDLKTGRQLLAIRAEALRVPASNQKLLTAATALARLGGDFQFTTKVYLRGNDVIVVGDHDPTVGDSVLAKAAGESIYAEVDRWAAAIKDKLADQPCNNVLVVVGRKRSDYRHADWPKGQFHRWYAAPVAALNFHLNCLDVTFQASGKELQPQIAPVSRFFRIVNKVKVDPKRHLWSLHYNTDDSRILLLGRIKGPTRDPLPVAVNDPPLLLGRVLAERLAKIDLAPAFPVRRVLAGTIDLDSAELVAQTTTPLAVVLREANKRSLNMAAECLFLRAGNGTWTGSARRMAETLTDVYGLDPKSFVIRDGSGLSRKNRITPAAMTKLLREMLRREGGKLVLQSLPIAGVDGTLRSRLRDPKYRRRARAKTGYLWGVYCLSGYVLDKTGAPVVAFSLMVQRGNAKAKGMMDNVVRRLVDWVDRQ